MVSAGSVLAESVEADEDVLASCKVDASVESDWSATASELVALAAEAVSPADVGSTAAPDSPVEPAESDVAVVESPAEAADVAVSVSAVVAPVFEALVSDAALSDEPDADEASPDEAATSDAVVSVVDAVVSVAVASVVSSVVVVASVI